MDVAGDEFTCANLLHRRGELGAAAAAYRNILLHAPRHFAATHLLGVIELQSGRAGEAVELIGRAVDIDAGDANAHLNLGAALMSLGRANDALRSFDRALELNPKWVLAWTNRGNAQLNLKQPESALASYSMALKCDARDPRAHCNLGNALRDLKRTDEALSSYRHAIALKPDYALAQRNCGSLLEELHRPAEALAFYQQAALADPNDAEAVLAGAKVLLSLSRPHEAIVYFDKALTLRPQSIDALNGRGVAQLEAADPAAALESFDRALAVAPRTAACLSNRGEALRRLHRFDEAALSYSMLLDAAPDAELAHGKLLNVKQLACEWSSFDALAGDVVGRISDGRRACAPFEFLAISDSAALQLKCAQIYASGLHVPRTPQVQQPAERRAEKIRVAYVSADFGNRPVSHLLAGVFEQHDRERFETIGMSLRSPDLSCMGQRVMRGFDRFADVSGHSDDEAVRLMSELDVHIAVDLMGYTQGSRPGIFLSRAAPIQVSYLGFPGTSGSACLDYIVADDFVIPADARGNYSEQVVYLPDCFQGNDARKSVGAAPTRRQMNLPDDAFVFCSFNNSYKINPGMFDVWCRVLRARPDSVLWLVADAAEVETYLRREAGSRGVDERRVVFADRVPYEQHLSRQGLADLFLDTLPFNAGSTASDALRGGLPLLTCAGEAFAARMAGSLLRALGLTELMTCSLQEYEQRALQLSSGSSELQDLRARLADACLNAPLFDARRFCRHLEAAYGQMWERWQMGLKPQALRVDRMPDNPHVAATLSPV